MFIPDDLRRRARENAALYPWAAAARSAIIRDAGPWLRQSDEALWGLMFGHTLKRSWMVWSDGYCLSCRQSVPMYTWEIDALRRPWKVRCPHCQKQFPTNDFYAFYRSGLDEAGVFEPDRANRELLFNAAHPDSSDPLRSWGVDDGNGAVEGEAGDNRWRFIGAYLVYGQWKQVVLGGIRALASAWVVTGDARYAHKAGVLLDRVADLYPTFDFLQEGVLYDGRAQGNGYVSTWHDACEETRALALAYDHVRDALQQDRRLAAFLSRKARQYRVPNPKTTPEDVCGNIEERILGDALRNRVKIESNQPRTDIAIAVIHTVLGGPGSQETVTTLLDEIIEKATAVDGVTGEKGLAGYAAFATHGMAECLAWFARMDPALFRELFRRHPRLREMWRFHIDTWCLGRYYPHCGDAGSFGAPFDRYAGMLLSPNPGIEPSLFAFLWQLYEVTGDPAYVQVLYHANGGSTDGLPYDLFGEAPGPVQQEIRRVIEHNGTMPAPGSVNKREWRLAILRSGEGENARALWLDYDAGGRHGHRDGMDMGLFAFGLDLMPDLGYPPVQYGGWASPRARWYTMTAAHNTVVVDGRDQNVAAGETTLWEEGECYSAIRASVAALIDGQQYERTLVLVRVSEEAFYILDIFRVVGGSDHAKFVHSSFGEAVSAGLSMQPAPDYGQNTWMRHFQMDPCPEPGWSVDWTLRDEYGMLPAGAAPVLLRYTDLTAPGPAGLAESWVSSGGLGENREAWIPVVMIRRAGAPPLATTFVAVLEPYRIRRCISSIRRLGLEADNGVPCPDGDVALEVRLTDGRRDLLITRDTENPLGLSPGGPLWQPDWQLRLEGEFCLVRRNESIPTPHGKSPDQWASMPQSQATLGG